MYFLGWDHSTLAVVGGEGGQLVRTGMDHHAAGDDHGPDPEVALRADAAGVRSAASDGKGVRHFFAPVSKSRATMSRPSIKATTRPSLAVFKAGSSFAGFTPPPPPDHFR